MARDGKKAVNGYTVLEVIGADVYKEYLLPLYSELYSQNADDFKSENEQVLKAVDTVNTYAKGKGVYVIDRGGSRKKLIEPMISKKLRFIIRIKGERLMILGNNQKKPAIDIASKYIDYTHKYRLETGNQGYKEKSNWEEKK